MDQDDELKVEYALVASTIGSSSRSSRSTEDGRRRSFIDRFGAGTVMNGKGERKNGIKRRALPRVSDAAKDIEPLIFELAAQIQGLNHRAEVEYTPLVQDIIRSRSRDVRLIEQTLDGLLDFCGYDPVLQLYRRLCRHYWDIDPVATASYVGFYREMWEAD